jgi:hypothetical protein
MEQPPSPTSGPTVAVRFASREAAGPRLWTITWIVENLNAEPLRLRDAWLPHGKFRSPRREFEPELVLGSGEETRIAFAVSAGEEAGIIVENCFVIMNVAWRGEAWRIFARITVTFEEGWAPSPGTVLITTQPVGFSGS